MLRQYSDLSEDMLYRRTIETLLESMFRRERETVQMLINVLFDAGSQNLIETNVPTSALRSIATPAAKFSRPVARKLGQFWVENQAPELIAKWLYAQVHPDKELVIDVKTSEELPETTSSFSTQRKINDLESQLRWRTRLYIGTMVLLGLWTITH